MPIIVAPSILSADFANLSAAVKQAESGGADWIHVDVMDGHFVPNLTIGPPVVKCLSRVTRLPLDVHLMISDPDRYLEAFAQAGATMLTVHLEACTHLQRTLSQIRSLGLKAGVALNPASPPESLSYVLEDLDLVLVMSVNPGFGGQKFLSSVVPKIARLRQMLDQAGLTQVLISVDGGINQETGAQAVAAGAGALVAGNAVFGSPDIQAAIAALHQAGAARQAASVKHL
jgi:ribulose-phosphate 3-epimerase